MGDQAGGQSPNWKQARDPWTQGKGRTDKMVARDLVDQLQMLTWSMLGPLCVLGLECHLHKAVDRGEIRRGVGSWLVFFL